MTEGGPDPAEAVWDDMRARWERGEVVRADDYLTKLGTLVDSERVLDFVFAEYCLREEAGEVLDLAEFVGRFPHLGPGLERQILLHRAVTEVAVEPSFVDPFPTFLPTGGATALSVPPVRMIAVVGSASVRSDRLGERIRTLLAPHCGERTRWYCRSDDPIADTVARFLYDEKQVRWDGIFASVDESTTDTRSDFAGTWTQDPAESADLVVAFWDGTCPTVAAILEKCRAKKTDHIIAYI